MRDSDQKYYLCKSGEVKKRAEAHRATFIKLRKFFTPDGGYFVELHPELHPELKVFEDWLGCPQRYSYTQGKGTSGATCIGRMFQQGIAYWYDGKGPILLELPDVAAARAYAKKEGRVVEGNGARLDAAQGPQGDPLRGVEADGSALREEVVKTTPRTKKMQRGVRWLFRGTWATFVTTHKPHWNAAAGYWQCSEGSMYAVDRQCRHPRSERVRLNSLRRIL